MTRLTIGLLVLLVVYLAVQARGANAARHF